MTERYRICCGGIQQSPQRGPWRSVEPKSLCLGSTQNDVHLKIEHVWKSLGNEIPPIGLDLLEVAAYIYAGDQLISRGGIREFEYGQKWRRHFRYEIPVRRPETWHRATILQTLATTLSFLTDDEYELVFVKAKRPQTSDKYLFDDQCDPSHHGIRDVLLFSGGIDSLCGGIAEILLAKHKVSLVSHRPAPKLSTRQSRLVQRIEESLPDPSLKPLHVSLVVNKGKRMSNDFNQRSRSFLFTSVAAVISHALSLNRLRICENGVTGLNLPISDQVVGARASRTTHPRTLEGFQRLFSHLFSVPFLVENPYRLQTKTQMIQELKKNERADLVSETCSCAHTIESSTQYPHCGNCSQCVERRLTCMAAGLTEKEDPSGGYASDVFIGPKSGANFILIERYVGTANRLRQMKNPIELFQAYPELYRALRFFPNTPAENAKQIFDLLTRHGTEINRAIQRGIESHSGIIARQSVPAESLLQLITITSSQGPIQLFPFVRREEESAPGWQLIVDRERYQVRWGNERICSLTPNKEFWLIELLNRRPHEYVDHETISSQVWKCRIVSRGAIHGVATRLRTKLRKAGLDEIEIDGNRVGDYRVTSLDHSE